MRVYTIGFTKKPASKFFQLVQQSGAYRVVDVRLNNMSQLAGFAKRDDLEYFLHAICNVDYVHLPHLAPTQDMLDEYKKSGGSWEEYEERFRRLMTQRRVEDTTPRDLIEGGCLLCSEHDAHHCHRRLVVEYLQEHWGPLDISHLK